jgi:hypothetical protein
MEKKRGHESMRAKEAWDGCDRYAKIYAETDTSFEVSGAPLATAANDTESLWGSTGTGAGVDAIVSCEAVLMVCG